MRSPARRRAASLVLAVLAGSLVTAGTAAAGPFLYAPEDGRRLRAAPEDGRSIVPVPVDADDVLGAQGPWLLSRAPRAQDDDVTLLSLRAAAAPVAARSLRGSDGRTLRVRPVSRIAWSLDGAAVGFTAADRAAGTAPVRVFRCSTVTAVCTSSPRGTSISEELVRSVGLLDDSRDAGPIEVVRTARDVARERRRVADLCGRRAGVYTVSRRTSAQTWLARPLQRGAGGWRTSLRLEGQSGNDDAEADAIAVADGALVLDRPGRTLRAFTTCSRFGGRSGGATRFEVAEPGVNRLRVRRGERTTTLPLPAAMRGGRSSPAFMVRTDDGGALVVRDVGGRGPDAPVAVYRYRPGADRLERVDLPVEARRVLGDEGGVVAAPRTGFGGGLVVETYDGIRPSIVRVPLDGGLPRILVRNGMMVSR